MAETRTVFCDESGYTGSNLLNLDQPVFVLATLMAPECRELKDQFFRAVSADELKHSKLSGNLSQQKQILSFLGHLSANPEMVNLGVTHKRYALVGT